MKGKRFTLCALFFSILVSGCEGLGFTSGENIAVTGLTLNTTLIEMEVGVEKIREWRKPVPYRIKYQ